MISFTDSEIIAAAQRGMRLPYSDYSDELVDNLLAHKRNNIAAIVTCADGISEYVGDGGFAAQAEALHELYDEIAQFCLFGLLGIGYFGISVEDGVPHRVDSTGTSLAELYGSVYATMSASEYAEMDRIDSMLLDQKDTRRFNKYLRTLKAKLSESFVSKLTEASASRNSRVDRCLAADDLFCQILIKIGRHGGGTGKYTESYIINNVSQISRDINGIVEPYRTLLEDDMVTNLAGYTMTDLKPVVPRHVF